MQLAAGSEHIINGRTVRINLAGPRPDQQQQQTMLQQPGSLQPGFPGMMPWQPPQPPYTALPTASAFGGMLLALLYSLEARIALLQLQPFSRGHECVAVSEVRSHQSLLCRATWDGCRGR